MARPRKLPISDEEVLRRHEEEGLSQQELADAYNVSRSAIASAIKQARDKANSKSEATLPPFPWVIAERHQRSSSIYNIMNAYRRHDAGLPCKREEVRLANEVRRIATERDAVVTYDYENGFSWTRRLPSDGDAMFVVRPNVKRAPTR
ncbi:sigma factor-like helix-turn-helix DNA-binding protein [Lentzea sp. NBRC 102530]|uniref:sigma factor-like helix-turn-helix DNA-binding protein n=1 Tax=Lentzea sp. NBRC 102530 TaxID=3032201 RepID=UPI0024A0FE41|nr:sigma factor-like helix-turn-helix DNA-binding protein [Lentzea sp. NBRC 102530]GLY55338.1 hypothetical protein Lesp01_89930 [Lentzea sp. NBRC 102530]